VSLLSGHRGRLEQYVAILVVISSLKNPLSKTRLTAYLNMNQVSMTKYLKTLKGLGLIVINKDLGRSRTLYSLTPKGLRALDCLISLDRELPFLGELIHTSPMGFLSAC
jgi:predicted transcriptional regulator